MIIVGRENWSIEYYDITALFDVPGSTIFGWSLNIFSKQQQCNVGIKKNGQSTVYVGNNNNPLSLEEKVETKLETWEKYFTNNFYKNKWKRIF